LYVLFPAFQNQCLMVILHLFSIETVYDPISTHIINQAIINLDIRIWYVVVEITDYSFFTTEEIFLDFENLDTQCLRARDLTCLVRPHSFINSPQREAIRIISPMHYSILRRIWLFHGTLTGVFFPVLINFSQPFFSDVRVFKPDYHWRDL
jgi:hypothetical protein